MNAGQTDMSAGQSDQGQNNNNSQGQENDQSQIPQPAPVNWQQIISDLQATMLRQGEELRLLKQQQVPAVASVSEAPPVSVPVAEHLPEVGNK